MREPLVSTKPNAQIVEEASAWFVEFSEGDVSEAGRSEFARWLKASPEHVRAYLRVAGTYQQAGRLGRASAEDAQALLARALAEDNVVRLPSISSELRPAQALSHQQVSGYPARRNWQLRAALAASVLLLVLAGAGIWQLWLRGTYSTGIGEQRSVTLIDGSTIELNACSRVRVRFTDRERSVYLLEGQALFHVAKDSQRPFVVRSNGTSVRAVGTQFDVYRHDAGTVVTVVEGRVAVLSPLIHTEESPGTPVADPLAPAPAPLMGGTAQLGDAAKGEIPLYLVAGEQVIVSARATPRATHADVAMVTAWTQRKLVFTASPLTEVVEEYNRYHEKPLVIADPNLQGFRISGVFSSADAASLIAFLRVQPNIEVQEDTGQTVLKSR